MDKQSIVILSFISSYGSIHINTLVNLINFFLSNFHRVQRNALHESRRMPSRKNKTTNRQRLWQMPAVRARSLARSLFVVVYTV